MKKNILEFNTNNGNKYHFDNSTGLIIADMPGMSYILQNSEIDKNLLKKHLFEKEDIKETEVERTYQYYLKLKEKGYFSQNKKYHEIENTKNISLNSNASQLILVVTEACNLRCHYCVYSEQYEFQKGYKDVSMTIETAMKAIDHYKLWFNEKREHGFQGNPRISFYGGEPFLEFNLIKQIVAYCKNIDFEVEFLATTNATVMTDEIIEFIVDYNFNMSYSLDGNQLNNDRNRVFINGNGTHHAIVKNIKKIQLEKKNKDKNIPFNIVCCFDSHTDMGDVTQFFKELEQLVGSFGIMYNEIYKYDTEYYNYSKERYRKGEIDNDDTTLKKSIEILRTQFIQDSKDQNYISDAVRLLFQSFYLYKNRCQGSCGVLDNACAVGDKMCFDAEGKLYVCEKATQQFELGDIHVGMDWERATKITNEFLNMKSENCSNCNISRMCEVCYVHFMKDNEWVFNTEFCKDKQEQVKRAFEQLYSYLEEDASLFEMK